MSSTAWDQGVPRPHPAVLAVAVAVAGLRQSVRVPVHNPHLYVPVTVHVCDPVCDTLPVTATSPGVLVLLVAVRMPPARQL